MNRNVSALLNSTQNGQGRRGKESKVPQVPYCWPLINNLLKCLPDGFLVHTQQHKNRLTIRRPPDGRRGNKCGHRHTESPESNERECVGVGVCVCVCVCVCARACMRARVRVRVQKCVSCVYISKPPLCQMQDIHPRPLGKQTKNTERPIPHA